MCPLAENASAEFARLGGASDFCADSSFSFFSKRQDGQFVSCVIGKQIVGNSKID
jgi:hypothetical protein